MESETDSDSEEIEMPSKLIDGNAIAARIRLEISKEVTVLKENSAQYAEESIVPGLAVILVGNSPESEIYVRVKKKACLKVGFADFSEVLPEETTQSELLSLIETMNNDDRIHGIIIQLPLPEHIDEQITVMAINPTKDVDGLHPLSLAKLATVQAFKTPQQESTVMASDGEEHPPVKWNGPGFNVACTPLAVMELLDRSSVKLEGAFVCVVGRSSLVGIPLAMLLMQRDATVTMVHAKTVDPAEVCQQADIVVVAVGRPELVNDDWIKEGAVVIDAGINSISIPKSSKTKLVGDVDIASVEPVCSLITPVPGGVGPVTLAMLLRNTLHVAQRFSTTVIDKIGTSEPLDAPNEEGEITKVHPASEVDPAVPSTDVITTTQPEFSQVVAEDVVPV